MPTSNNLVKRHISIDDLQNDFLLLMNRISIGDQPLLLPFVVYLEHSFENQFLNRAFLLVGRITYFHSKVHDSVLL